MGLDDLADKVRNKHTGGSGSGKKEAGGDGGSKGGGKKSSGNENGGGKTSSKRSTGSSSTMEEVKVDLFSAFAKVFNVTKANEQGLDKYDIDPKYKAQWKRTARDVHQVAFENFGVYGGHAIAEKYGFNLSEIIEEMKIRGGNDKKMSKEDAENMIKAIANAQVKAEGMVATKYEQVEEGNGTDKDAIILLCADTLYDDISSIMREHKIQKHAERFGLDYEDDIVMDILENQADVKDRILEK